MPRRTKSGPIVRWLKRRWVRLRWRCDRSIVDTKMEPGYADCDEVLLRACFAVLEDFIENERPFEFIDYSWSEEHQHVERELRDLYSWWQRRKDRDVWDFMTTESGRFKGHAVERAQEFDTAQLIRLMKIRLRLWT